MANQVMRITLKAYDHQLVDASAAKRAESVCGSVRTHTETCTVTACRTWFESAKRRRLFLWQVK